MCSEEGTEPLPPIQLKARQTAPLSRPVLLLFAMAAGLSVANIYCAQPLLEVLAVEFQFGKASIGSVITLTQIGYALGLFFIVPLGDRVNRRRLVLCQISFSSVALVVVYFAASKSMLLIAMFLVGLLAVVVQVLVAFAASLALPEDRGSAVGTVTSGIVLGILLARTASGILSDLVGWRAVYLVSAVLTLLITCALFRVLPELEPPTKVSYPKLLRSVIELYLTLPILRVRAFIALFLFAAFGTLWTSLVLPLSEPPYSLSRTVIGLFGLAGMAGAVAAGRAGRLADQGFGQWTTGISLALLLVSWIFIASLHRPFVMLVIGIVLLDFAVQAVHVTNQSMIFAARPEAKSRLVAAYMFFYSIGSGLGAYASTMMYAAFHWTGVCMLGACFSAAALGVWATTIAVGTSNSLLGLIVSPIFWLIRWKNRAS
jgi:predicted MFS family arabinose efflux permease